jgi:hypothetical protein
VGVVVAAAYLALAWRLLTPIEQAAVRSRLTAAFRTGEAG